MAHYSQKWGGIITDFEGQVGSPLYPGVYPNDISVEWQIMTQFSDEVRAKKLTHSVAVLEIMQRGGKSLERLFIFCLLELSKLINDY